MNKTQLKAALISTAVAAITVAEPSSAAIAVTAATDVITTDGETAITAVGTALIGLAGLAVVFRWIKGSIFG